MKWNDISLKTKLISLFLILALVPTVIISTIGYRSASISLKKQAFSQLTSVREMKARQIEDYFEQIDNQVLTFSESQMIIDFSKELKSTINTITENVSDSEYAKMEALLRNYYETEFLPRLNANVSSEQKISKFFPDDKKAVIMQYHYIANNFNPVGEKHKLDNSNDGSAYSEYHEHEHPIIRDYLEKFGYYDIFLVNPDTGRIFYSVYKELDYATSLITGPYKDTNFSEVFREAVSQGKSGNKNAVVLADFKSYEPSYASPASFIASPVFDNEGEFISVLIFQMPVEKINSIMTGNEGWKDDGLGTSGETYLVGHDYTMKSISRFYIEDKDSMFDLLRKLDYDSSLIDNMSRIGTTINYMKIETEAAKNAFNNIEGTKIIKDYRGVRVLSSFKKLHIYGLEYAILSEIDEAEIFLPIKKLRNNIFLVSIIVIIVVIITSLLVSKSILMPIEKTVSILQNIAEGEGDLTSRLITSKDEFGKMAYWFNKLLDSIESMVIKIKTNVKETASSSLELSASSQQVNASIELISDNMTKTANDGHMLHDSALSTKDETEKLVLSIKFIASSAQNSSGNAEQATNLAKNGSVLAKKAEEKMILINDSVNSSSEIVMDLGKKSERITSIVDVINSISEQTNLLALNAAIEAARAGEAGRGFSVVADEIRKLAEESRKATKEIESLVGEISTTTDNAVDSIEKSSIEIVESSKIVNEALGSLEFIVEKISSVTSEIDQIKQQTDTQLISSDNLMKLMDEVAIIADKTAGAGEEVSNSIQETTYSMQEISASTQHLSAGADELQELVDKFKVRS